MQLRHRTAVAALLLLATAASADDGKAGFEQRRDTMNTMGRALYLGVGRVAKGRAEFGPDTVAAGETLARLTATLGTLFPAGSAVPESNMKPTLLTAPDKVAQLIAGVQAEVPGFVADVRTGDKARIAAAFATMNKACDACHSEFRKEE